MLIFCYMYENAIFGLIFISPCKGTFRRRARAQKRFTLQLALVRGRKAHNGVANPADKARQQEVLCENAVTSHDVPVPLRKAIRAKPHVLTLLHLPRKITIKACGLIAWCPIPLRKGIAAKSHALKVPRLPHKSTIELCRLITWCPSFTAKSDSNKASCA